MYVGRLCFRRPILRNCIYKKLPDIWKNGKEIEHEQKENIQFMVPRSGSCDLCDLFHHSDGDITVF